MIIRILGEGQLRVDDSAADELNVLDAALGKAVNAGDEQAFRSALAALLDRVRSLGTPAPAEDAIEPSDLILPYSDAGLEDVQGHDRKRGPHPRLTRDPPRSGALSGGERKRSARIQVAPRHSLVGRARGARPRPPSALGIGQNGIFGAAGT